MLWIVGPVAINYREYLAAHDIEHGQFLPANKNATAPHVIRLDFSSLDNLQASLRSITDKIEVDAVMVTGLETYVLPAAYIADHFCVPYVSPQAALAATDKLVMRQKFIDYDPSITPTFRYVETIDDALDFFTGYEGPVMLKPANLMKSLYITKNRNEADLRKNFENMQRELPAKYKELHLGEPHILVESFMAGSMHTVAGFVDANGVLHPIPFVVDCITARDIGKDDSYLFARNVPSSLSDSDQAAMLAVAKTGVKALGLTSTAIHAELILTSDGPKLIEIAARIGGFRPRMYEQAYGIDMYQHAIDTAYGQPVQIQALRQHACAVLELFPEQSGRYAGIATLDTIQNLASYASHKLKTGVGDLIGKASAGYRAPLIITLVGSENDVAADMATVRNTVTVLTTDA